MKKTKDALKEQEAEMLKQFNVEQLEERLEMKAWLKGAVVKDNSDVNMPDHAY
jgi:hypothetical protein